MACPNRHQALRVLTGQLSPGKSNDMLAHFRRCGECREAFDFAAKTMTKTAVAGAATLEDEGGGRGPRETPRYSGPAPYQVKRNRRTMIVFLVAAVALMLSGIGRDRKEAPAEPATESYWKRALAEGTPVVLAPAGAFEARPRVITALVPPGSGSLRVTILDDAGRPALDFDAKPGFGGCFVEESSIDAPGGAFRACRLVIPFPEAAALPLDPGRTFGVVVSIAGGHASSSLVFQVTAATTELQGPPGEAR